MKYACFAVALSITSFGVAAPALAEVIGTAAAVNPDAVSRTGGARRVVRVGANVLYRERIETSATGSVQVLFVDRTTLNIGPNSQIVIDEFVFDPASNTGHMAATLTRGVLRFVGGQTSHTGGATIRTPATTLGVRGGVATIRHDGANGTRVISHFGSVTAQTASGAEVLRRSGFALTVGAPGRAPLPPQRAAKAEIDAAIAGTGGARPASRRSGKGGGGFGSAADSAGEAAKSASQQALSTRLQSFTPPPHTGPGRPTGDGDGNGGGDGGGDRGGSGGGEGRSGNRHAGGAARAVNNR